MVLRGGRVRSVSVDHLLQGTQAQYEVHSPDEAFVIWAGLWAEARFEWGSRPLDGEDEEGVTFEYYLDDAGARHRASAEIFLAAIEESDHGWHQAGVDVGALRISVEREIWPRELEEVWPAIRRLARALLDGDVLDHAQSVGEVRGE